MSPIVFISHSMIRPNQRRPGTGATWAIGVAVLLAPSVAFGGEGACRRAVASLTRALEGVDAAPSCTTDDDCAARAMVLARESAAMARTFAACRSPKTCQTMISHAAFTISDAEFSFEQSRMFGPSVDQAMVVGDAHYGAELRLILASLYQARIAVGAGHSVAAALQTLAGEGAAVAEQHPGLGPAARVLDSAQVACRTAP